MAVARKTSCEVVAVEGVGSTLRCPSDCFGRRYRSERPREVGLPYLVLDVLHGEHAFVLVAVDATQQRERRTGLASATGDERRASRKRGLLASEGVGLEHDHRPCA